MRVSSTKSCTPSTVGVPSMAPLSSFSTTVAAIFSAVSRPCMAAQAWNDFSTASAIFSGWNSAVRPSRLMMVLTITSYILSSTRLSRRIRTASRGLANHNMQKRGNVFPTAALRDYQGGRPSFRFCFPTGFPQVIHHRNHNILCFAVPRADTYSTRESVRVQSNKMYFSAPEKNRINFDVWSMSRLKVVNDVGSRENRLRLKRDLQAVGARLMGSWGATDRVNRTSRGRGRVGRAGGSPRPAA